MVLQLLDRGGHALQKCLPGGGVFVQISVIQLLHTHGGQCGVPQEIVVAVVDHVLKDYHAQFVALVVKFLRLYLDVLAQGVKAQRFHSQDVFCVAFRCGRSEQTVGPVTLIQKAVEEVGLAIEAKPGIAAHGFDFQYPQGKIGFYPIFCGFYGEIIEERILGTPEMGRFRLNGYTAVYKRKFSQSGNSYLTLQLGYYGNGDSCSAVFDIQFLNIIFRYAFQPHGLPDAGYRCVPHTAPLQGLLAVREGLIAQIVTAADPQLIFFLQSVSNVHRKGFIATVVLGQQLLVYINLCDLVCRTDVQQHTAFAESLR